MSDRSFKWLTWNINGLKRSDLAPPSWSRRHTANAIRSQILRERPDILALQECPGRLSLLGYRTIEETTRSHAIEHPYILLLVRPEFVFGEVTSVLIVDEAAVVACFGDRLAIASIHLAPFNENRERRLAQMAEIVEVASVRCQELLLLGDSNMRKGKPGSADRFAETREIERAEALGLSSPQPPELTFNAFKFYRGGGGAGRTYYSRYFQTSGLVTNSVEVWSEMLDLDGHQFSLSDHHAVTGRTGLVDREPSELEQEFNAIVESWSSED